VVRGDNALAVPCFARALELASDVGDTATMSEALRHLGIAAHADGRLDDARRDLEESTRLRREAGLSAGVASNLIGLTYIAAAQGRRVDAAALLTEADTLATAAGARRIARHVEEAREALGLTH
jgi:Flp pilus assembly protein TadD